MEPAENLAAEEVARRVREAGVAPLVAAGWSRRVGHRRDCPGGAWVREVGGATSTYFDLASLTKPMTAVAVARAGALRGRSLGDALPTLAGARTAPLPIELFLAHRAGLRANAALFEPLMRGEDVDVDASLRQAADAVRDELSESHTQSAPGSAAYWRYPPLYSDLGYVLAGAALARDVGARDAGAAVSELVVSPLSLQDALGTARELEARGVPLVQIVAPTEVVPWRGGELRGRVHDENAWALTGLGGSGHAGMFGTVDAVLTFGEAVLDALEGAAHPFGGPVDLGWLVAERPGGTLRAGFDGKSASGSSAGSQCGPRTFGHLGFTGTSLWLDPDEATVVVLLSNRVCPTRDNVAIRTARPVAHDALFARARSTVADRTHSVLP